jgi:hypothetical protein
MRRHYGPIYVFESEDSLPDGPRWSCHEHVTGFDDIDHAVAWALQRARTVLVSTFDEGTYWAGDPPAGGGDSDAELRPWPPSPVLRAEMDARYESARREVAAEDAAWEAFQRERDAWLAGHAPEFVGLDAPHSASIALPGEAGRHKWIEFEEFVPDMVCAGRRTGGGPAAFGTAREVIAATSGPDRRDAWVDAVCAALVRERGWHRYGLLRRGMLSVRIGSGEMFHVSPAANRDSIAEHGLDWRLMRATSIARNRTPELGGIFLSDTLESAEGFLRWSGDPADLWAVNVDGLIVENAPNGYEIVCAPIPPERLRLRQMYVPPRNPL